MPRNSTLPPKAQAALAAGNKGEAIRQLQLATGMSLAQAKGVIEVYGQGTPADSPSADQPPARKPDAFTLPPQALEALQRGHLLEAIKIVRQTTGAGLAEAKTMLEALQRQMPRTAPRPNITQAFTANRRAGLAPGEEPRGGDGNRWFVLFAIVAGLVIAGAYLT